MAVPMRINAAATVTAAIVTLKNDFSEFSSIKKQPTGQPVGCFGFGERVLLYLPKCERTKNEAAVVVILENC